ncbi:K02A2.6-like, partial [Cordylochernes scorpioides]
MFSHVTQRSVTLAARIQPPETFDFSTPNEWPKWRKRFERYLVVSGMKKKEEADKIDLFMYLMGDRADDIFRTFKFEKEEEATKIDSVLKAFDSHFCVRKNIIYERAKFNSRIQEDRELVDEFITSLYKLADSFEFESLHEQLIRDRIAVGVRDKALSERMQLDSELTLEKAVKMVRQQEAVRQQQVDLQRPSTSQKVNQAKTAEVKAVSELDEEIGFLLDVSAVEDSSNLDDDEGECRRRWTAEIQVNGKQLKFKLDSQADVTCVPLCLFKKIMGQQRLVESDINIRAAEFSELQTVGMFLSTLRNGNYEIKEKIYVIRRLSEPLLSRRACELLNLARRIEVVATRINPIKEFPEVFEGLGQIGNPYENKLKPGAKPYAVHTPRRVPIPLMEKLKTRLEELEKAGIIAQVNVATEWCAPTVIAGKPNGDIRLWVDLSRLNEHVQREVHPMPVVEHMLGQLGDARFFSKLDANSGFHQIPLSPDCQHLTTFIIPFGRYKYCRMPFGISLAPEYFQRVMSIILQGMDGVMCYLDDILIFASDSKTHDRILRLVLRKLKEAKVTLNKAKCVFGVPRINFLGHILDEDGIRPDPAKIEAVARMPAPTDVHGVRRFLGMVNHLGRFVENLSEIVAPLNQLLVKGQDFVWDCSQERAFRKLKEVLTTQLILAAYDVRKPTMVSSDASSYGLGAVLKQEGKNGIWRPVAYSSRTMTPTEKRYAQIEKEALAITWACERFQDFLLGKRFRIETDHKPLIPLFSTKEMSSLTPRLQRFRMRMMRFGFEIVHIPGKELLDAGALSRQPLLTTEGAQQEVTTLKAVVNYLEQGWPDKKKMSQALLSYWHVKDELGVQNGLLMRSCRLVIPASMKLEILDKLHAGHFGITKTRLRARETVWWPGISEEIAETVRKCSVCIQEAVSKHEPLIPTNFPTRPWQKIGMDLFKFENKWYLVVIDYYSRFPEMVQLDRLTASAVVRSCKSIFARHGIPETVVSDNGTQFGAAREFANFARQYGFQHVTSSPRFPQSNGMAEAGVKIAKLILKKNQDPSLGLLEYRSTPLGNGYSPAELLMGRKLRTTLPIAPENLNPKLVDSQTLKRKEGRRRKDMKSRYDRRCGATDMEELSEGDTVWIADMRTWGIVKQKASTPRSYMVDTPVGTLRRNRFHLRKGVTVQYPADPSTPTFSGEELVENEKTPVVDYPSNDSEDGQIRTRSGRIVKPQTSLTKHKIETIKHRPYRVSPTERQAIQTVVDKMLDAGIIRHSESPWSSPVILVKKKDGNWRFCVDYRRLNKVTKKDVYPLPRIVDTLDSLKGAKFYSSLDLRSGYWKIEVDEADRDKTIFITPDGLYEFLVISFGLCNAPATFERMVDKILRGLKWTMVLCYLDDIVVYSKSFNEHLHRLEIILQCLNKAELRLNPKKCLFGTERIRVFGHLVDSKGIYPDPEKIEAIDKFPTPKSITDVRSFIGLCSYYLRFIENFAEKAAPLHEVLKKEKKFTWNSDQQDAFDSLKKALMSEPVLAYFEEQLPTELHTDASGCGIGAVLVQINDGKERPVGYASRTLSKAEKNYSTTERECLAAIWPINKFRPYLFGREFYHPYHPQTNGLTERLNKTLANMIAMYVSFEQKDWDVILPYVRFAYNTAKQDTTGFTPFKLIRGREAETTVDTLFPNPHEDLQEVYSQKIASRVEETRQLARLETLKAQEKDKARYDSKHEAMDYNVGDLVWIFIPKRKVGFSEKLMKMYFGPYRVTRKLSDVTFEVEPVDQPTRRRQTRDLVHVLRMKPYHDPEDQADLFKWIITAGRCSSRKGAMSLKKYFEYSVDPIHVCPVTRPIVTAQSGMMCLWDEDKERGDKPRTEQWFERGMDASKGKTREIEVLYIPAPRPADVLEPSVKYVTSGLSGG